MFAFLHPTKDHELVDEVFVDARLATLATEAALQKQRRGSSARVRKVKEQEGQLTSLTPPKGTLFCEMRPVLIPAIPT